MDTADKVFRAIELWELGQQQFDEASKILSSGPSSFYYTKMRGYIDALFNKYAPFQVGDRVMIKKKIKADGNWSHSKHFLIPGAKGEVKSVDYYDGAFCADVMFDDETWIDSMGMERPVSRKHVFRMWENQIKRVKPRGA